MTVTKMRLDMAEWEFTHWLGLAQLRKERHNRQERRRQRKRR